MFKRKSVPAELVPAELVPANPAMIYSPKNDMYKVIRIFQPELPTLDDLIRDHLINDDPRLPERWIDIRDFKFEERKLVIRLHWYQDQKAENKVNCEVFLLGERHTYFMDKVSVRLYKEGICKQIALFGYEEN